MELFNRLIIVIERLINYKAKIEECVDFYFLNRYFMTVFRITCSKAKN